MRKAAVPACLVAALLRAAGGRRRAGRRPAARIAVREGHAQRPAGRAREPRGPAGPARAPHGAHRRGAALRPAHAAEHARRGRRRLPARRGRACRASRWIPNFEDNRWVYLYYSPPGDTPGRRSDDADLQRGRRAVRERRPSGLRRRSRARCGSRASSSRRGKLDLGHGAEDHRRAGRPRHLLPRRRPDRLRPQGNLYLSTGDDSNPFESDGYSPIDERPNRNPAFDAQRTSATRTTCAASCCGSARRPTAATTSRRATCSGLGTPRTKPEIYAMGLRNPFRFDVNRHERRRLHGGLLAGRRRRPIRPAARPATAAGCSSRKPANFGWPYCVTPDIPYVDYDFATETSGEAFNCDRPVNDSPLNTGQRVLPPVAQPDVWYSYNPDDTLFPELFENADGNGISPMAGPAYHVRQGQPVAVQVAEATTTASRCSTSGAVTTSRSSA